MIDNEEEKQGQDPYKEAAKSGDKKEAIDYFAQEADTNPARQVESPEEDEDGHRTLTQVEEESPTDSDLKTTLKRLFPKYSDPTINEVAQAVMVARVFPDTILDRIYLTVVAIVERQETNDEEIDVMMTINLVTTAFEIGLDAKGRADAIELHASAAETENLESLGKSMGAF